MISSMISSQVNPSRAKLSRCRAYPWSAPLSLYICAYVFVIVWTSWYEVPPKCAGRGSQIASAEAAHLDLTSCSMSQQAKGLSPMGNSADILAIKDLMFKRRCGSVGTVRAASPASLPSTTRGEVGGNPGDACSPITSTDLIPEGEDHRTVHFAGQLLQTYVVAAAGNHNTESNPQLKLVEP